MWSASRAPNTSQSRTAPSKPAYQVNSASNAAAGSASNTSANTRRVLRSRRTATRVLCTGGAAVRRATSLLTITSHCSLR